MTTIINNNAMINNDQIVNGIPRAYLLGYDFEKSSSGVRKVTLTGYELIDKLTIVNAAICSRKRIFKTHDLIIELGLDYGYTIVNDVISMLLDAGFNVHGIYRKRNSKLCVEELEQFNEEYKTDLRHINRYHLAAFSISLSAKDASFRIYNDYLETDRYEHIQGIDKC
jgi:hypothetical protein